MECIEARALKSRFQSQVGGKTIPQVFCNDDVWCSTGINSAAYDDFSVEELLNLDFSDKEFQDGCLVLEDEVPQKGCSNVHSSSSSSSISGADEFDSLGAGELSIPVDDLENLEWLSLFVDDSTSGLSLLCPAGGFTAANSVEAVTRPPQQAAAPSFPLTVPSKPRSKRSRPTGRPWPLESPPLSTTDSSSASMASSYGSSTTTASAFVFANPVHDRELFSSVVEKPPAKKQKRKAESESGSIPGRRCTHCHVQKTPQWRTGPLGPKTLCNACGVRFKSGRLFPEYRPACSPTFSQEIHSNSHRKVLEMRRKKEMVAVGEPGSVRAVQTQSL